MTKTRWILVASLALANTVGAAACATRVEEAPKVEPEHRAHRGPAEVVIDAAVEHADLSVEQHERFTAILTELSDAKANKAELKRDLKASASEVVRAGTTDSDAFDDAVDQAMSALEERVAISSEALAEVHGMLSPDQRANVAVALRAHIADRFAAHERRVQKREGLKKLTTHLMLTGVQLDELKKVRKQLLKDKEGLRPTRAQLDGLVDAFEGDDFVAAMDAFHASKLAIMRSHVEKMGGRVDTVLSLLDDDQRNALAELIVLGPKEAGLDQSQPR